MLQKERADGVQNCCFLKTEVRNEVSFNNCLGILFWGLRSGEKVHDLGWFMVVFEIAGKIMSL